MSDLDPVPNSGAGGTELETIAGLRTLGCDITTVWAAQLNRRIRHGNLHYVFELPNAYWSAIRERHEANPYEVITVNLGQSYLAAKKLKQRHDRATFIVRSHGLDDHLEEVLKPWMPKNSRRRNPIKGILGKVLHRALHRHMALAARYCDGYVVSNSLDVQWLQDRHGLDRERIANIAQAPAEVFQNTPPVEFSTSRLNKLLYVANYHFAKSPDTAARASTLLLAENPSLALTWICHQKDHERVRSLFPEHVHNRIELKGWMTQAELLEVFDTHGIFLYPTLFDGFAKVFLEAMSRGLCVIGTRAGGMVDLIQHGRNGYFCEFGDAPGIQSRAQHLLSEFNFARQMSQAAIETARKHTWERVATEMRAFFQRIQKCPRSQK